MRPVDTDEEWSPAIADAIAEREGVVLTGEHWQAISCWRELTARYGRVPAPADLTRVCGIAVSRLIELFPGSPGAVLSRIAGVPE